MSENNSNNSHAPSGGWPAVALALLALIAIGLLFFPPIPPWLPVIAVAFAIVIVLSGSGVLSSLRGAWQRSLSGLPTDDQRSGRWKRALSVVAALLIALLLLLPPLPPWLSAGVLVLLILAVLGAIGGPRKLRRWLGGFVVVLLIALGVAALGLWPRPGLISSRSLLSWMPDWLVPATTGTVRHFSLSPRGELDGLILDDRTEVHVPPHLSTRLATVVRVSDGVNVRGFRAGLFSPVIEAVSITDSATGGMLVDTGPPPPGVGPLAWPVAPMQRLSPQGRLDMWLHGPAGDVNGALLADGTILRFPAWMGDQWAQSVTPGQTIRAEGWGAATAYGTVVSVQTLG
jgi:hypothetical protein